MRRTHSFFTTLATFTLFTACDAVTAPEDAPASAEAFYDGRELDAASLAAGNPPGYDDPAASIPGFGGLWFDARCNLHVVLTADADPAQAKRVLTPLFRRKLASDRCPAGASIIVHRGMFTYTELTRWLHEMRPVGDIRGVLGIGLSVPANRIVVGVAARTVVDEVVEAVRRLGIPDDAVIFRVGGTGRGR
jgi:hypothetical protein